MKRRLARILDWTLVGAGIVFGFFALLAISEASIRDLGSMSGGYWPKDLAMLMGIFLAGLVLLTASLTAMRNRTRAALIMFASAPILAFLFSFGEVGYTESHGASGDLFIFPYLRPVLWLALLFFIPVVIALFSIRRPKRAIVIFFVGELLLTPVFVRSPWARYFLPGFVCCLVVFGGLGLFWWQTARLGWPSLRTPDTRPLATRITAVVLRCAMILGALFAIVVFFAVMNSSLYSGTCRGKEPIVRPERSTHAVFTTKILWTGRSFQARRHGPQSGMDSLASKPVGDWAVGIVEQRFWGLPRWSRFVLLRNYVYWRGETYFIDGNRTGSLLTMGLPIVDAAIGCDRTKPVVDAGVDLRVLREKPPVAAARLIGWVQQPQMYVPWTAPPKAPLFEIGAKIRIVGPANTMTVTTDATGMYEVNDLPEGDYTVQLMVPANRAAGSSDWEEAPAKVRLDNGAVVEVSFRETWNGRLEGQVTDDLGNPAHLSVMLLNPDGTRVSGYPTDFVQTDDRGYYQIKRVPPGHYVLVVNPSGPDDEWPYDIQYYPSGPQRADAQILDVADGQQIKTLNFTVPRLSERTVAVQIALPDGQPAAKAGVAIAYEHTSEYSDLKQTDSLFTADEHGFVNIHLYGSSRVRVFAEVFANQDLYSQRVESRISEMPDHLSLVVASSTP